MSEEQKIIDLENEISFLKDALCEKQKEIEEKTTIIMAGAKKVKQLEKEIKELKEKIVDLETKLAIETIDNKYNQEERDEETIPRYKIREKLEGLEEQKEKLKYDGDRCFADYEQFCKNLKFFKEQIDELLEEK